MAIYGNDPVIPEILSRTPICGIDYMYTAVPKTGLFVVVYLCMAKVIEDIEMLSSILVVTVGSSDLYRVGPIERGDQCCAKPISDEIGASASSRRRVLERVSRFMEHLRSIIFQLKTSIVIPTLYCLPWIENQFILAASDFSRSIEAKKMNIEHTFRNS